MAKTFFIKSDSEPLIRAMWSELKAIGYTTTSSNYSLNAHTLANNVITNNHSEYKSLNKQKEYYAELTNVAISGGAKKFTLPEDWDAALAFAKEQIESFDKPLPEYVECISSKTNNFTVGKIYNFPNPIGNDGDRMSIDILDGYVWKFKPSTKEAFDVQNKAAIESLEENCYYKVVEGEFWMVGKVSVGNNGNNNGLLLRGECSYSIDSDGYYNVDDDWCYYDEKDGRVVRNFTKLSKDSDEVMWLEACNKANKYIPKEEALKPHPMANCVKGKVYWSNNSVYPKGNLWRFDSIKNTGFINISSIILYNLTSFEQGGRLNNAHWENLREATSDEIKWLEACEKAGKFISKEEVLNPKPKFNIGDWVHLTWDNDGDEDIFQIENILKDGFYVNPLYRNGKFLLDGVPLLMQPKRQTFRLATEKEIKEILIKEAKRRYPVGTKFNTPDSDADYAKEQVVIKPIFTITKDYRHRTIITIAITSKNSEGICYVDGKWAEIITNKTVTFGVTQFTCYKGYAECSYGKVTKDEVKEILDYFDQDISILGYKMSIVNKGDWFVKFGCQQDKLSKIREIYNKI